MSDSEIHSRVTTVPPYTALARVYDAMMSHVNYHQWAKYIFTLVKRERLHQGTLLDVGCGTGRFLQHFLKSGMTCSGCDPSEKMLAVAQQRLPQVNFFRSGFPELAGVDDQSFDVITCLYDTMNYLPTEDDFVAAVRSAHRVLKSPGLFIFDMVSREHCRQYFHNYSEKEIVDERLAYERESYFDATRSRQINRIRIYTEEGIFEEIHEQAIFDFRQLAEWIEIKTDFQILAIYEDFTFHPIDSHSGRAHFVLKKVT